MNSKITIEKDQVIVESVEQNDLLITDNSLTETDHLSPEFVRALIELSEGLEKSLVINSTNKNTESVFERLNLNIVESYSECGLVTAVYDTNTNPRATAD
jgi:hypothetical protein